MDFLRKRQAGMDPFVQVKCGGGSHEVLKTKHHINGGAEPNWSGLHNVMKLRRTPNDDNTIVISVLDRDLIRDDYIGGNRLDMREFVDRPDEEVEKHVQLFTKGTPGGGEICGKLFLTVKWVPDHVSQHIPSWRQGLPQPSPKGTMIVTALRAETLQHPKSIIRDLSTYVDTREVKAVLGWVFVYVLFGLIFYVGHMSTGADLSALTGEMKGALMRRTQGEHGEWDTLNTLVFIMTSFTTVGYGNHPSLTTTTPPCEYPGLHSLKDSPFSNLMPENLRGGGAWAQELVGNSLTEAAQPQLFRKLSAHCYEDEQFQYEDCWVIADDEQIFDFKAKVLWQRNDNHSSNSNPRNYSADAGAAAAGGQNSTVAQRYPGLLSQAIPGLGVPYGFRADSSGTARSIGGCASDTTVTSEDTRACFAAYASACEELLVPWREEEDKKASAKVFTMFFILFGVGLLGTVAGSTGAEIMSFVHKAFSKVETVAGLGLNPLSDLGGQLQKLDKSGVLGKVGNLYSDEPELAENRKGAMIAFFGLIFILLVGTVVYSLSDSMTFVDAGYFTVVTATTVGFGDYVPSSNTAKVFTLFYVPLSVVMVAGALQRMAMIPLQKRNIALERYILESFGEHVSEKDFDEIRRTTHLKPSQPITPNDFVLAMLMRLGKVEDGDMVKCRRLFTRLDTTHSGTLDDDDIADILSAPSTRTSHDLSHESKAWIPADQQPNPVEENVLYDAKGFVSAPPVEGGGQALPKMKLDDGET